MNGTHLMLCLIVILHMSFIEGCTNHNMNEEYDPTPENIAAANDIPYIQFMSELERITIDQKNISCNGEERPLNAVEQAAFDECVTDERYLLYENFQKEIRNCKDCTLHSDVTDFQTCMGNVRKEMLKYLNDNTKPNVDDCFMNLLEECNNSF